MENNLKKKISKQIENIKSLIKEVKNFQKVLEGKREIIIIQNIEFKIIDVEENDLQKINLEEIQNNLEKFLERCNKLEESIEELKKYNVQYKIYLSNEIDNFSMYYEEHINTIESSDNRTFIKNEISFLNQLKEILRLDLIELYEQFKYDSKNYVIFGKNGAGKTSLLHQIRYNFLTQNSFAVPANRGLECNTNSVYQSERIQDLNSTFNGEKAIDILLAKILKKEQAQLKEEHINRDAKNQNTIVDELIEIFDHLGLERKLKIDLNKEEALLYEDDIEEYSLSDASDGEKNIVYMIMAILLLPQNAYIFIDEPEKHLNGTLMIELFDKLEEKRSDLKFVYLTHNIDFIESRNNVELIYLEKTKEYNTWKFKKMHDFEEIDFDIILSIEGTKKDIIFCEGDNRVSIDYKIYSNIYKNFLVLPVCGCQKVIENVKVINEYKKIRRSAYGIVDNDFKDEEEIEKLKVDKIFTLEYSEIENLLLTQEIVKKVNELHTNNDKNIKEIEQYLIEFAMKNQSAILKDYLNKKYNRIIKTNILKYNDNLEEQLNKINEENKIKIQEKVNKFKDMINKFIEEEEYDKLLTIIPGKMIINKIVEKLGFCDKKAYIEFIINNIQKNEELKLLIENRLPKCSN